MKPSSSLLGADFEDEIAKLYETLGYTVEKDVEIDGQQIDLVLSLDRAGIGKELTCRMQVQIGWEVDNQDVFDFIHVYETIRRSNPVTGAVLVTNNGFTRAAKRAAIPHHDIFLMQASRLKTESVIRSQPHHLVKQYEDSMILSTYVHQRAYDRTPNIAKEGALREVSASILQWTSRARGGACFILLGDYGTGETSLPTYVRYLHRKTLTLGDIVPLPIVFLLNNFYKFDKWDEFVVHPFHENYHSTKRSNSAVSMK